jgi:hypothetical protein
LHFSLIPHRNVPGKAGILSQPIAKYGNHVILSYQTAGEGAPSAWMCFGPPMGKKRERDGGLAEGSPHYYGHRARLRERFREAGPDALSDYELLEAVLFRAQPGAT